MCFEKSVHKHRLILRSSNVVDLGINRKRVTSWSSNLGPILLRFRDIRAFPKATFSRTTTPTPVKISGVPLE